MERESVARLKAKPMAKQQENISLEGESIELGRHQIPADDYGSGVMEIRERYPVFARANEYALEKARAAGAKVVVYHLHGTNEEAALKIFPGSGVDSKQVVSELQSAGLEVLKSTTKDILFKTGSISDLNSAILTVQRCIAE